MLVSGRRLELDKRGSENAGRDLMMENWRCLFFSALESSRIIKTVAVVVTVRSRGRVGIVLYLYPFPGTNENLRQRYMVCS
jgi:hypothetical protein